MRPEIEDVFARYKAAGRFCERDLREDFAALDLSDDEVEEVIDRIAAMIDPKEFVEMVMRRLATGH